MSKSPAKQAKLSHEQFTMQAIRSLRDTNKGLGIHTVYSHFNAAFRQYFSEDPVLAIKLLVEQGKVTMHYTKGGAMIYDPKDKPQSAVKTADKVLDKILGG